MSKDGSSGETVPKDLPEVADGPAPGAARKVEMKAEAGIIDGSAIRPATIRPSSITAPVEPDVAERIFALHEARKVLETTSGGSLVSGATKNAPSTDDLIRVARYIVTGTDPKEK